VRVGSLAILVKPASIPIEPNHRSALDDGPDLDDMIQAKIDAWWVARCI